MNIITDKTKAPAKPRYRVSNNSGSINKEFGKNQQAAYYGINLGFELPEDRGLDMNYYPHICIELNDNDGYEGDIDIFMLDEWDASEDMTNEDKERLMQYEKNILLH